MTQKREEFFDDVKAELKLAEDQIERGDRAGAVRTSVHVAHRLLRRLREVEMQLGRKLDRVL